MNDEQIETIFEENEPRRSALSVAAEAGCAVLSLPIFIAAVWIWAAILG